jgi:hypothetical protein
MNAKLFKFTPEEITILLQGLVAMKVCITSKDTDSYMQELKLKIDAVLEKILL